ncbi:DNA cross-link repair protein SNM1 isoform X1 [Macadamia integrifolia]|uniref:DNA cross-link repair protein SNM1 isoform X1 n=1 Tax=Macadamia integrifolia TaxID=60698 RepID=UPI001C4EB4B8|nr:DNA cross-link repair protein SNM1 isoform X1 [Macadamia integrifolia]
MLTDEEEDISIDDEIDENGFPSLQLASEEEEEACQGNGVQDLSFGASQGGFASDFYRSGTDWSCLLDGNPQKQKRLKQADLFQVWGFKKTAGSNPGSKVSSLPSREKNTTQPISLERFNNRMNLKVPSSGKTSSRFGDNSRRICPFYKKIPGTPFTVDAFRYGVIEGCSAYFLSHFHHDHYSGLSKGWSHGPIYCTPLTARLVRMCLLVNPSFICPLELETEHVIEGIKVTMLDANHCPGAALIHFRLEDGRCYLHTGDFRACRSMQLHPHLANHKINLLYLDTTYCNPKYRFPSKEDVLDFVVMITKKCLTKQPKTLIVVGAYSIGKECVYLAISKALGVKIYANSSRRRILQSFGWPELSGKLCSHGEETPLHILPMSSLKPETLKQYLVTYMHQYTAVLAFRPTGWTYSEITGNQLNLIRPRLSGNVSIYGVPYSEHSSFLELREFVQFLRPGKIIPTVNVGNAAHRNQMQSYFQEWLKA